MIKKNLPKKDIEDWKNFLKNIPELQSKDQEKAPSAQKTFKFDFHGYTISNANHKIAEIINYCYKNKIRDILIITGKGIHSKGENNAYKSDSLNKLKFSIPDFISNNDNLKGKVISLSPAPKHLGGEGALIIKLKKL